MNSTTFANKVEIQLYSTLISIMSGINRLKSHSEEVVTPMEASEVEIRINPAGITDYSSQKAFSLSLMGLQQTVLAFLLWIVLGFAAGFLLGMIGPK